MTNKEYREYKDEYLTDFKKELEQFLNHWLSINNTEYGKKLNELIVDLFLNTYKRIKTLSYFPEYELPENN